MAFDPDAFLANQAAPQQMASATPADTSGFDPDAFLKSQNEEKYGTTGEMIKTGLEGAAQGLIGPLAPAAERLVGVNPEDIRMRSETNPWAHGLGEAAGFVGGALTGTGEAALVGKAGEAVAGIRGLSEATNIGGRLAAAAVKMGTEMAFIGAGNEGTKLITQDPNQSVGSAISNIGLNAVLGAAGGAALTGFGIVGKSALNKIGLNSENLAAFKDRLLYRGANLNPNEAIQNELKNVMGYFEDQGSEIGGANGLKARALSNLMPPELTPEISNSVGDVVAKSTEALQKMAKEGVPERLMTKFQSKLQDLMEVVTDPQASVDAHFDALNEFKKELANFSKGNFGPFAVPAHSEAYDFLKITKELGHGVKESLEDPSVWGEDVAGLQKDINSAWQKTLGSVKQVKGKFMSMAGDELVVDPAKFNTYVNQAGKATSETVRQQILGKFLDGMEDFHDAVSNIYEKAGLPPPEAPGMGALKESLGKQSIGAKLADAWYDKLAGKTIGTTLGAGVGGVLGHALPIPGAGGAGIYLGGKLGSSVLPSFIQPMLEKAANSAAFNQAAAFGETVLKGNNLLERSTKNLFSGGKLIPSMAASDKDISGLDDRLKKLQENPNPMVNVAGDIGHYMPDHAQAMAQTTMNAVNTLNAQRPQTVKQSPLDSGFPPSKAAENAFKRTLGIAQQPLTVLKHMNDGTLMPSDIKTLQSLYPNYYMKISQELHNAMTNHLAKDGKIPYHLRQSMSLFLGEPLESSLRPQNIQAAQSVFAQQQAANAEMGSPGKSKMSTAQMAKVSDAYRTPGQASQARQSQSRA